MSMSSPLEDQIRGLVVELNEAVEELFRENRQLRAHLQNSGISTDEIAPALGPDPKARSIFGAQSMSLKRSEQPARDMKEKSERSKLIDLFTSSHKHKRKLHGNLLKYRQKFSGHSDGVWEVSSCQSPHFPNILCSASADGSVALWNNSTNASHSLIYKGHRGSVNSARFHPGNPRLLLTASGDLSFHVIRIPESFNYEFYSEDPAEYNPLYSRDGSRAQSEAEEKSPAFIPTKKEESKLEVPSPRTFEISDQKLIEVDQPFARVLNAHREPVSCAGWITNGEYIGTGSWDCNAAIWNLANGDIKEVHRLKGHEGRITNIDTIVDINCVLTSSTDHTFRLWDLRASSNAVNIFNGHSASVNSAIFSKAEGAQVLASSSEDRTVNIWDIRSANSPIAEIGSSSIVNRLSFSPSGKLLAAPRDDGLVHVFNIEGDVVAVLNPSDTSKMMSTSACWSSDERFVFSSHWDRNVYAWEFHYQSSR